jgi:hypothetical protein
MMPARIKGNIIMARRLKLLSGLSTLALSGAVAMSACARKAEPEKATPPAPEQSAAAAEETIPAETVGGESEGAALVDVASDTAAYLSGLQIVRGHLRAGLELYTAGDRELGPQHLRHPQAEILTSLAPAFAAHGSADVVPAIDALAAAGEAGAEPAKVGALGATALATIAAAGEKAEPSLKDRLLAAAKTATVAADEYSVAVKDGAIVNLHEYHDAYGFLATIVADLALLKGANELEEQAIASALDQARVAASVAPTVIPPAGGLQPASVIYGAAARLEIAARSL